jgi:hypothetical protein
MSRSTASPPPERSVVSGGRWRVSEGDEGERQAIRPRHVCQPRLLGARTAPRSMTPTYAAVPPPRAQLAVKPSGGALGC